MTFSGKACYISSQTSRFVDKRSRNKRKFRTETPLVDSCKSQSSSNIDCIGCEDDISCHGQYDLGDINQEFSDLDLGLATALDSCKLTTCETVEQMEEDDVHGNDWTDLSEHQLREIVLQHLDTIFTCAIKNVVSCGYTQDVATNALLVSSFDFWSKDIQSSMVDNALAYLARVQDDDPYDDQPPTDLEQLAKIILANLLSHLQGSRPYLSAGDALWCLLVSDMNVHDASTVECGMLNSGIFDTASNSNSLLPPPTQMKHEPENTEVAPQNPCKPIPFAPCSHDYQSDMRATVQSPNLSDQKNFLRNGQVFGRGNIAPSFGTVSKMFGVSATLQLPAKNDKFGVGKKIHSVSGKRDSLLRQKSQPSEKSYRTHGSKGTSRTGKHSSFGGILSDKKLKPVSGFAGTNVKNAILKPTTERRFHQFPNRTTRVCSSIVGPSSMSEFPKGSVNVEFPTLNIPSVPVNDLHAVPVPASWGADTELTLSLPTKSVPIVWDDESTGDVYSSIFADESMCECLFDSKEFISKLLFRKQELQNQPQERTEWTNQKVMQAAHRLNKENPEFKTLRHEKEEAERFKKERLALHESTVKKLSEMENATCKASSQAKLSNSAVERLEAENAALRVEMEAAKLQSEESTTKCEDAVKREKTSLMNIQSCEKGKNFLQEELSAEKRKVAQVQKEIQKTTEFQNLLQMRKRQDESSKQELLDKVSLLNKEIEQIKITTKSQEDMLRSNAEKDLLKYKCEFQKLEKEISQLRLKTDSSKIAALKRGIIGNGMSKLSMGNDKNALRRNCAWSSEVPQGDIKRERECVMCLSEEMSVLFLPCAHQVMCTVCNEHHEKKGMMECPSCRGRILQRVQSRFFRL